jgi:hypothetical protein
MFRLGFEKLLPEKELVFSEIHREWLLILKLNEQAQEASVSNCPFFC